MSIDINRRNGRDPDFRADKVDGPDSHGMRLVGHCAMNGRGDAMQIDVSGDHAYIGHLGEYGVGTSVVDISDPSEPTLVTQVPVPEYTHSHKAQVLGDTLIVNHEQYGRGGRGRTGLKVFDVSQPQDPKEIGFLPMTGKGVHRTIFWEEPYAFVSGSEEGWREQFFMVVDLSDPSRPKEVSRWWLPGQWEAGGEPNMAPAGRRHWFHHALVRNDRAYCGWWDAGLVILDVEDLENPKFVSRLDFGLDVSSGTHTALPLPGRDVVIVTDECVPADHNRHRVNQVWVVDVSDETEPKVLSNFPVPAGNWCERCQQRTNDGHFGPHNLHEMKPGSLIDPNTVYATYFNGGVRVFDVSDPSHPTEFAHYIPEPVPGRKGSHMDDIYVAEDGLIYATDRYGGGLYVLEMTGRP